MVRNSNTLYRVVKLNSEFAPEPPGFVDCQPYRAAGLLRCAGSRAPMTIRYDAVLFSFDGTTGLRILNCGVRSVAEEPTVARP